MSDAPLFRNRPVRFAAGGFIRCRAMYAGTSIEGQIVDVSWGGFRVAFARETLIPDSGVSLLCDLTNTLGESLRVTANTVWSDQEGDFRVLACKFGSDDPVPPATLVRWTIGSAGNAPSKRARLQMWAIVLLLLVVCALLLELGRSHQVQRKLEREALQWRELKVRCSDGSSLGAGGLLEEAGAIEAAHEGDHR